MFKTYVYNDFADAEFKPADAALSSLHDALYLAIHNMIGL